MNDYIKQNNNSVDPGLKFSEVTPNVYLAQFTEYKKERKINTIQARYYLEQIKKAAAEHPGEKISIINDTSLISNKVKSLSNEARKAYLEAYKHPQVEYVAMVGFNRWLKNFILMLAQVSGRSSKTIFLETTEQAMEWLQDNITSG